MVTCPVVRRRADGHLTSTLSIGTLASGQSGGDRPQYPSSQYSFVHVAE